MNLRFCYCTDLHGNISRYQKILQYCIDNRIGILHLGADLLPKGSNISERQKDFIKTFLNDYFEQATTENIKVLAFWGNDDMPSRKKFFKHDLFEESQKIQGYTFGIYPFCPDYPFGFKFGVKLDSKKFIRPPQLGLPYEDVGGKIEVIKNINQYFSDKGTIEEDLKNLPYGEKVILSFHCPPAYSGLDECHDGRRVGSEAIYDWLNNHKVALSLHGHIHESPSCSGKYKASINGNTVIQPGDKLFCDITIGDFVKIDTVIF